MAALDAIGLMAVWDRSPGRSATERALDLLAASDRAASWEDLAALSLGARDARLLRLREQTLATPLQAVSDCPSCGERHELELAAADVGVTEDALVGRGETTATVGGLELTLRPVSSADLLAVSSAPGVDAASQALARRCVLAACDPGGERRVDELPAEVLDGVGERLAGLDELAEIRLRLKCSSCGQAWSTLLDVADFVWREFERHARRLLGEVATLARSYGWSERDILAMPARRRAAYLELVGS